VESSSSSFCPGADPNSVAGLSLRKSSFNIVHDTTNRNKGLHAVVIRAVFHAHVCESRDTECDACVFIMILNMLTVWRGFDVRFAVLSRCRRAFSCHACSECR